MSSGQSSGDLQGAVRLLSREPGRTRFPGGRRDKAVGAAGRELVSRGAARTERLLPDELRRSARAARQDLTCLPTCLPACLHTPQNTTHSPNRTLTRPTRISPLRCLRTNSFIHSFSFTLHYSLFFYFLHVTSFLCLSFQHHKPFFPTEIPEIPFTFGQYALLQM